MRKIFVDSSVVIADSISRTGASRSVLRMTEIGLFQLVISRQVLAECERNLQKKFSDALPFLSQVLTYTSTLIIDNPLQTDSARWLPYIESKDAPILEAAVQSTADRLLTLNTKHFTPLVAQASGLRIQTPGELVQEIRSIVTEGLI